MTAPDYKVDRSRWQRGPWDDEPDREEFKTSAGFPGLIVRAGHGSLCGYVAVPPGHPLHGAGDQEDDVAHLEVHGGITYSRRCQATGPICHVPAPGEPDDVWWLGFDCAHSGDWMPNSTLPKGYSLPGWETEYRDMAYVRAEVESLAAQLAAKVST